MCDFAPTREVTALPTCFHGPGREGGLIVEADGAKASAAESYGDPLPNHTAMVAQLSCGKSIVGLSKMRDVRPVTAATT